LVPKKGPILRKNRVRGGGENNWGRAWGGKGVEKVSHSKKRVLRRGKKTDAHNGSMNKRQEREEYGQRWHEATGSRRGVKATVNEDKFENKKKKKGGREDRYSLLF